MTGGRILYCIPTMGGGGAERQLAYLAKALTDIGWDVHVALLAGGPHFPRLQTSGAVIHTLAARSNYDLMIFWQLLRIMRVVKPDLVQVWMVQMEILGGMAAEVMRIPWIFSERSSVMAYPPTLKHRLRVLLASTANAMVSNSTAGDLYWHERLPCRVPRYVIPNALPLDEIASAKPMSSEETGLHSKQRVVLFVGRLSPEKNIRTLLFALRSVLSRPQTVAVLCGEGPLRSQIEQWLTEYNIVDRVRLLGYIPDIWRWMKRASLLVSPAFFEGSSNVVLEAMGCGCPLVVSDIPAHREFLDAKSALFVKPHEPEAIAAAIRDVLVYPEAAARRAQVAQTKVAQWSPPDIACQYAQVYRSVFAGLHLNKPWKERD